jgi:hypothetical protein
MIPDIGERKATAQRRIPAILAGVYALLGALSLVPVFTGDDPLSGIFLVVLGLPWTPLLSRVLDAVAPALSGGAAAGVALGVVGIALNTAIVYFLSRWVMRGLGSR